VALINGSLQIGRSAITTAQAALSVTGNNLANAANRDYSRQVPHLTPTQFTEVIPGKYTGTGVTLSEIRRQVDDALNNRIRIALGDSSSSLIQQQAMTRVEATFNELTDSDLSTRLNAFFQAWSGLANQPQDTASRGIVIQEGRSLANFVSEMRDELTSIQADLDSQVQYQVAEADTIAAEIARLNNQVVAAEAGRPGCAAALRDQRDKLLKDLSELVNITTREVNGGSLNVFIGNDPLIQYSEAAGLSYIERQDSNGNWLSQVVFADNNQAVSLTAGKIHGLITARDDQLGSIIQDIDNWSKALIFEVNKLHSTGRGLDGLTSLTSSFDVEDPTASLADTTATGLPWQVSNGVFNIHVTDSLGNTITETIKVDIGMDSSDTTLNDLAAAISAVSNITATVDGSNCLTIQADPTFTFGFSAPDNAADASNVLAALGINSFFDGSSAGNIEVSSNLISTPGVLAVSATGMAGNGDIAAAIATLGTTGVSSLNGLSLTDRFTGMISQIATDSKAAQDNYIASDVVVQTLESERQSISGVSVDEEAIHMIAFQRAFQAGARYVSLIDQMLDEVIALAR